MDDKGEIVFIEMNSPGGSELLQVLGINAYGNKQITKEILDKYLIESFFYVKANMEWDYREFSDHVSLLKYQGTKRIVDVPEQINGKETRIVYANAFDFSYTRKIIVSRKTFFDASAATKAKVSIEYK